MSTEPATIVIATRRRPPALARFFVALAVVLSAYILAGGTFGLLRGSQLVFPVHATVLLLLALAGFSALLYSLDQVRSSKLAAMGLARRKPALRDFLLGSLFGGALVALAVVVGGVFGKLTLTISLKVPGDLIRIALTLWTLLVAALVEEVVFRGYPFQRLLEATGPPAAVLIVSAIFGVVHLGNPHGSIWATVNTAEVGVLLALAYLRTRSLWMPWGFHFGWNTALGLVFGLPVSGYSNFAVVVHGTLQGPRWLTGGTYGIEASAVATALVLLGIVLVWRVRPRPAPAVVLAGPEPGAPSILGDPGGRQENRIQQD